MVGRWIVRLSEKNSFLARLFSGFSGGRLQDFRGRVPRWVLFWKLPWPTMYGHIVSILCRSSYSKRLRLSDSKAVAQMGAEKHSFFCQSVCCDILRTRLDTWGLQSSHTFATYSGSTRIPINPKAMNNFKLFSFQLSGAFRSLVHLGPYDFLLLLLLFNFGLKCFISYTQYVFAWLPTGNDSVPDNKGSTYYIQFNTFKRSK